MDKRSISTSMAPEVVIGQVLGDLQVKGWEEPEVVVNADAADLDLEEQEDGVRLSSRGDCFVRLPHGATIQVEGVHGDGHFKLLDDRLTLGTVHGSLVLRSVAATQVETVHGELSAKEVDGDLIAEMVYGHADVREVQGACLLNQVKGHLELRNVDGDIKAHAEGNARIRLSVMSGTSYDIQAEGNVHCYIPEEANLKLDLSSQAQVVKIRLPDESKTIQQSHAELTLGNGEMPMKISAGGVLYLFSQEADWSEREGGEGFADLPDDFSQQIAQQVEAQIAAQMDMMTRQMNEQMAQITQRVSQAGFSPEQMERIMDQARRASERQTERAQEKMQRAQEKLQRKLESAQRRREQSAERRTQGKHSWSFEWPGPSMPPSPPTPPTPPQEPATEEERLIILRMLEQKKITLDEADQLLSALEGKEQ
jgi:hypothetical protein